MKTYRVNLMEEVKIGGGSGRSLMNAGEHLIVLGKEGLTASAPIIEAMRRAFAEGLEVRLKSLGEEEAPCSSSKSK